MASTMEGMLKAMDSRPGKPRRFLERTLRLLKNATQVEVLALVNDRGEVVVDSGTPPHAFTQRPPEQTIKWFHDAGLAQLWIPLDVDAFDGSSASNTMFPKDMWGRPFMRDLAERHPRFQDKKPRHPSPLPPMDELADIFEVMVLDIPVQNHIRSLRHDLLMRGIVATTSLLALLALLWVIHRQEHLHLAQAQLRDQEQQKKSLEEKSLAAMGLAHETRTPLSVLRGHAQLNADSEGASQEVRERSLMMVDEVDRITSRLNDFIAYARQPDPRISAHNIRDLVEKVTELLKPDLEDKAIKAEVEVSELKVMVDGDMMVQVIFNLLLNSIQMLPEGGRVTLFLETAGDLADLHVLDNGPGFPKELGEACFKPYVTHREGGTGLGLAVVQQIVLAHGARLELLPSETGAHLVIRGLKVCGL